MKKADFLRKLSSRKFWALLADLVICALVLFGVDTEMQVQIAALIAATGGVVGYMLAEASVDKSDAGVAAESDMFMEVTGDE